MKNTYKVLWEEKIEHIVWIEADSEEEALDLHSDGDYKEEDVISESLGIEDIWVVDVRDDRIIL